MMILGSISGILYYNLLHTIIHFGPITKIRWVEVMRKHHLNHHFKDQNHNFGTTIPIWDYVIGTDKMSNGKVTEKYCWRSLLHRLFMILCGLIMIMIIKMGRRILPNLLLSGSCGRPLCLLCRYLLSKIHRQFYSINRRRQVAYLQFHEKAQYIWINFQPPTFHTDLST